MAWDEGKHANGFSWAGFDSPPDYKLLLFNLLKFKSLWQRFNLPPLLSEDKKALGLVRALGGVTIPGPGR